MKKNFLLLFLFAISICFCTSNTRNAGIIITATLKGPSAMAMIRMIEEKPLLNKSVPTKYIIRNEPNQVKTMIMKGSADFAVIPSTMAALLYNKEVPYILAAIPVWGTLYLFGNDTSIHTWKDLKGKKVSLMARGMTPDIMFRYLAIKNGINPDKDMELDYSFPNHIELANAIAAGVSEMGVISEPHVTLIMDKNSKIFPILDLNIEWQKLFGDSIPFAQTALLVKRELAEKSPEIVDEYLSLLEESVSWVNNNPIEASRLIVKYDILQDTFLAQKSIPRSNLHYAQAFKERAGIQEYLKVFYTFNPLIIGGKLPDEKFYYKEQAD